MIFHRKSAATRALHQWMKDHAGLAHGRSSGVQSWQARLSDILAQSPDLESRFKGKRPLAWCMSALPESRDLLEAIVRMPADHPGAMKSNGSIQDVVDAAGSQTLTEHIARALHAVLSWSQNVPSPSCSDNSSLLTTLVRLHPEVDHQVLEKLRQAGYDPNAPSYRGYTVAHCTVANQANAKALAWSLEHCNLEAMDRDGRTVLALAVDIGALHSVVALIGAGADPRHPSVKSIIENVRQTNFGTSPTFTAIHDLVQARSGELILQGATAGVSSKPRPAMRL